jgi:hypothetical protein
MTTSGMELGSGSTAGFFSDSAAAGGSVLAFPLSWGEAGAGITSGVEDSCRCAWIGKSANNSRAKNGASGIRE